jgi:hypothetical protein
VPLRGASSAKAAVERETDNRLSARKNFRILFLHSHGRGFHPGSRQALLGRNVRMARDPRTASGELKAQALVNAAKFTAARSQ